MKTCNACGQVKEDNEFVFLLATCRACQQKRNKARGATRGAECLPCWVCGSTDRLHGHHADYDQPMSVVWLCEQHHNQLHREHGHAKSTATQKANREK